MVPVGFRLVRYVQVSDRHGVFVQDGHSGHEVQDAHPEVLELGGLAGPGRDVIDQVGLAANELVDRLVRCAVDHYMVRNRRFRILAYDLRTEHVNAFVEDDVAVVQGRSRDRDGEIDVVVPVVADACHDQIGERELVSIRPPLRFVDLVEPHDLRIPEGRERGGICRLEFYPVAPAAFVIVLLRTYSVAVYEVGLFRNRRFRILAYDFCVELDAAVAEYTGFNRFPCDGQNGMDVIIPIRQPSLYDFHVGDGNENIIDFATAAVQGSERMKRGHHRIGIEIDPVILPAYEFVDLIL